jgi:glycosyltransferase involved in cell wall biosynthesis
MNILFVHEVDWLNKVVFDIHSLAEALSLRGHKIYAVDYENTWRKNGFFDFGSLKTTEFRGVSRALPGAAVDLRRPGFIKIPGLGRLTAAVTTCFEIDRTIRREKIDAVVLYSVPTSGLQVVNLARKYNIPVIFRSIDILNQLVTAPALRPLTRLLEKRVYARAAAILTLTPGLSDYVVKLGAHKSRVSLLLMPVDTGIFRPLPEPVALREKWGLGRSDPVVLFMGTLFDFSGLDRFIPEFARVVEKVPGAKLLIVGDGPQRARLDALIVECKLEKQVIVTGFQPYDTMPQYINLAAVCINTFDVTGATRDIFPGKTVQFLACGRPFVATVLPGMTAVIPGEEQGVVYVNTPQEMSEKIIILLRSEEKRKRLGEAGLAYIRRVHSYESIARQLEEKIVAAKNSLTVREKDNK